MPILILSIALHIGTELYTYSSVYERVNVSKPQAAKGDALGSARIAGFAFGPLIEIYLCVLGEADLYCQ